jgi:hypothetical protein
MATQAAVSGNVTKNDGGTLLHAGTIASSRFANLTIATTTDNSKTYGSTVILDATYGTHKPLSAGVFGQMEVGQFVAKVLGTRIAQTDNTFLRSGAAETASRRALHFARGNRRHDITDISAFTGVATQGGSKGALFTYVNPEGGGSVTTEPLPTDAVPGRLVYMVTGKIPDQDTYKVRTNS